VTSEPRSASTFSPFVVVERSASGDQVRPLKLPNTGPRQ
jgi:hypothetical protein